MFRSLPDELILLIVEKLSFRDLRALCLVSRHSYDVASPFMYQTLVVRLDKRFQIEPNTKSLVHVRKHLISHVKEFVVDGPTGSGLEEKCCHQLEEFGENEEERLHAFNQSLLPFLRLLTDNSLRRFSWNTVGCLSDDVVGTSGYLPNHQRGLLEFHTMGQGDFPGREEEVPKRGLPLFNRLHKLRWEGIFSSEDLYALGGAIRASSDTLEYLDILVYYFNNVESAITQSTSYSDMFSGYLVGAKPGESPLLFPSLKQLALRDVPISSMENKLVYALNLGNLQSLTLWNCRKYLSLLASWVKSGEPICLKTLEIVQKSTRLDINHGELEKFLASFYGLTSFYLGLDSDHDNWQELRSSIDNHRDTLKNLVIHPVYLDRDRGRVSYGIACDGDWTSHWPLHRTLSYPKLEVIGTTNSCNELIRELSARDPRPTCSIIHVRRSGNGLYTLLDRNASGSETLKADPSEQAAQDDSAYFTPSDLAWLNKADSPETRPALLDRKAFLTFAHWAFGPQGIPKLKILAYGDFSLDYQSFHCYRLLCRNQVDETYQEDVNHRNYRDLKESDYFLQSMVQENLRALGACPRGDGHYWHSYNVYEYSNWEHRRNEFVFI